MMMCESCKELTKVHETLEVDEILGSKSGYFSPWVDMPINYCPVCGKKLPKDEFGYIISAEKVR